jgi:hypothetical protein
VTSVISITSPSREMLGSTSGAAGSEPTQITLVGNHLFVDTTTGTVGREIWVADLTPANPADYDRNGLVEQADYDFWLAHFGETAGLGLQADGNEDGTVDAADYTLWRDEFTPLLAAVSSLANSPWPTPSAPVTLVAASNAAHVDARLVLTKSVHRDTPPAHRSTNALLLASRETAFAELGEEWACRKKLVTTKPLPKRAAPSFGPHSVRPAIR